MASIILFSLACVGAYLNNNIIDEDKRVVEDNKINKSEDIERRNVYNTRRLKKIRRNIDVIAGNKFENSKHTKAGTNIVPNYYNKMIAPDKQNFDNLVQIKKDQDNFDKLTKIDDDLIDNDDNIFGDHTALFEKSNELINDVHYKKYLEKAKKGQSFLDQFETPEFDGNAVANAENSLNIDLERGLKEGFSVIGQDDSEKDMTYGLVKGAEFRHNNMVPFYSSASYGDFNDKWDQSKEQKLDLFSGSSREYVKKKEHAPLFNPFKDLTHTHGMPSTTDYRQERYYASLGRERRNETLFQPQRVAPGVNQGYNANGVDGFHPSYRYLPKTIDELRPANRPQITYSAPVKPGFKRNMRPVQAPVIKYRPETYRNELRRNMVKNLGYIRAPKVRDNYYLKETNKETTLREHYGVAGNAETSVGKNVPIELIPKIMKTRRQVYRHPGISNLSNTNRFDHKYLNWLQKSYFFPHNERSTTQFNQHVLGPQRNIGGVSYNPAEFRAKNTIRELTENNQHITGVVGSKKGSIVYDPSDIAKTTIKESTENNQHIIGASRSGKGSVAFNPLEYRAKNTVRELTENNQHLLGASRTSKGTIAFNPDDKARTTVRELTENNQHLLGASRSGKGTIAFNPLEYRAKNTVKELTENNQHVLGASRAGKGSVAYNPNDKARTTVRELTEMNQHLLGASRSGKGGVAFNPLEYRAKNTVKELTENNQHVLGASRVGKGTIAFNPNDRARTTVRELTENNQHLLGASRSGKGSVAFNPVEYRAKNTIKELTEHNKHILGASRAGFASVAYNPNNKARTTVRELTEKNQHILGASRSGKGGVAYNPVDYRAKNTLKELTEHKQHILGANRQGQGGIAYDPSDVARTTIKELTEHKQHILGASRAGKGGIAFDPNDKARTTVKELTEHKQHILGANRQGKGSVVYDPNDKARTTMKELTEHNQHLLGASRSSKGGVAYCPQEYRAKSTNRQTTQNTYYVPPGHSYGQDGPRIYDAEYNAEINDCKEIIAMSGRAPTKSNYPKGPVPEMTTYRVKQVQNKIRNNVPDCRNLNALFRMPVNFTQAKVTLPQEERRLDENVLAGLDNNPFAIPSYFNDCSVSLLK